MGKQMNNKIILILFFLFLLVLQLPLISTEETFERDSPIDFIHIIRINDAPNDEITANITILDPNERVLIGFESMTYNAENKTFNFTLPSTQTAEIGDYKRCVTASAYGINKTECFEFEVNLTGTPMTTTQGILYFAMLIFSVLIFLLVLYGAIKIPFRNNRSIDGFIIGINTFKYVKLGMWAVSYLLLIWVSFMIWNISEGFLFMDLASGLFRVIFFILAWSTFPLLLLFGTIVVITAVKDSEIRKLLERGIHKA